VHYGIFVLVIKISAILILARRRRVNFGLVRRCFIRLRRIPQFCIFNFDFCTLKHLTLFQIMTCEKTTPRNSAQFEQFGAPFGVISRVIRDNSRTIPEQFKTFGAMAPPS
jgi:hypothetical protein